MRAAAANPDASYRGVFVPTSFDAHGDIVPQAITIYRLDPKDAGVGAWLWEAQVVLDGPEPASRPPACHARPAQAVSGAVR